MKKTTLTITLLITICFFTFGQEKFIYNYEGLNPEYVVTKIDDQNQTKLFEKSINWIKETYKNPDEVIKTTIDKKKIRFEGSKENIICVNVLGAPACFPGTYTIELEFKDNKYKFTPLILDYRVPATQYTPANTASINFESGAVYYKKGKLRKAHTPIPPSVEKLFNGLNLDLSEYLKSNEESDNSDDW